MLLLPADVLRPRRPDEHFAPEAAAARAAGLEVALVDHDALADVEAGADDAERAVARVPAGGGEAVYRGWMLRSERYAEFARALARRGVALRTGADQYQRAHELPGWYPVLAPVTSQSVWTTGGRRHDPDVADAAAAWRVACRFRDLREDDFTGGFVLRRFEQFTSGEFRTWWMAGRCALTTPHPDTPDEQPPAGVDLDLFAPLIESLGLPFVTLDLAQRTDGAWRVVELGDGQVSDRAATTAPETLISAIFPGA